jgi:hypothetical protein
MHLLSTATNKAALSLYQSIVVADDLSPDLIGA